MLSYIYGWKIKRDIIWKVNIFKEKKLLISDLLFLNIESATKTVLVCVSFVQVQHKGASLHFAESSYKLWCPLHSPILQRFVQRGCINVFWQGHYEYFRYLGPAVTRGWYCCVDGVESSRRFKSCEEFRVTLQCWETTIFTFKGKAVMSVMALKAIYWFLIQ